MENSPPPGIPDSPTRTCEECGQRPRVQYRRVCWTCYQRQRKTRQRTYVLQYAHKQAAVGFWIPCQICGNWRHLRRMTTPFEIWRAWNRACPACKNSTAAARVRGRNRQMITAGKPAYGAITHAYGGITLGQPPGARVA